MAHAEILEQPQPLKGSVAGSLVLHGAVFGSLVLYASIHGRGGERFGDMNAIGGGSVLVNSVDSVPLPSRGGEKNLVANNTESRVPSPPPEKEKLAKQTEKEDPDAIALKGRKQPDKRTQANLLRKYMAERHLRPNQVYSSTGAALSTPMVGMAGSGGVGLGQGSPFGARFGWYQQLLQQRIAEKWRTQELDPRLENAPPVIVRFEIMRDGGIRDVVILQRSGNYQLDASAKRAVEEISPFEKLPDGFERSSATVEMTFQLKR